MSMSKEEYKEFLEFKSETRERINDLQRLLWNLDDKLSANMHRTDETEPSNCIGIVD